MDDTTETDPPFPLLSAVEARVLGVLVEKESTTPEQYPLTENAVVVAANQKTSRDPLMNLSVAMSATRCAGWRSASWCAASMAHGPSATSTGWPRPTA
jgi:hypothetical protein